jgi:diaminopimelate decarboxylase
MFSKSTIEKFKKLPTPFYFYDMDVLRATLDDVKKESEKYGYIIHYALKANSNTKLLNFISSYGFGADCVSGNEIERAIETGFKKTDIVFAGVGKSDKEIETALRTGIFCFNCESTAEIEVIDEIANRLNKTAQIALRINPNVDAQTHKYITTGIEENKFGLNLWELEEVVELITKQKNISLKGMHFHIGSQIKNMAAFKGLCARINELQEWFLNHNINIEIINVGGGLGIDYENPEIQPDFREYFSLFNELIEILPNQKLHIEPGRSIIGQCGSLISKVLYIKNGRNTCFAIIDAGMTDLIRPALYNAYHKIENLTSSGTMEHYNVVGPICESSDSFGKYVELPESRRDDIFAIRSAGAYGETMASRYNLRDLAPSVFSDEI